MGQVLLLYVLNTIFSKFLFSTCIIHDILVKSVAKRDYIKAKSVTMFFPQKGITLT